MGKRRASSYPNPVLVIIVVGCCWLTFILGRYTATPTTTNFIQLDTSTKNKANDDGTSMLSVGSTLGLSSGQVGLARRTASNLMDILRQQARERQAQGLVPPDTDERVAMSTLSANFSTFRRISGAGERWAPQVDGPTRIPPSDYLWARRTLTSFVQSLAGGPRQHAVAPDTPMEHLGAVQLAATMEYRRAVGRLVDGLLAAVSPSSTRIAFVISLIAGKDQAGAETVDADTARRYATYIDGAASLAVSIEAALAGSEGLFDVDLVAFVSEEAPFLFAYEDALRSYGWSPRRLPLPLRYDEIEESYYKQELNKSGCCGMTELLKLQAFQMHEYDRIVVADTDLVIARNIDELLLLPDTVGLVYTNGSMEGEQFQGGFWAIRPSQRAYDGMVDLARRGRWFKQRGWENSGIGWFYGGPTIQGILPYWFFEREPPSARLEVSRCIYNSQAGPQCLDTPIDDVSIFHFTQCPKPWSCIFTGKAKCHYFNDRWWDTTRLIEHRAGGQPREKCRASGYQLLPATAASLHN